MTAEKKDRKPLRIKNLADLKRHIKLGTELVATAHQYHPDIVGLTRVVTKVQTNGFYSKIKDQPDHAGKLLILKPSVLKDEFKVSDYQLFYAESGFGCSPTASGRKVFGKFLKDGESTNFNRSDFLGVIKDECIPEWAAEKLAELEPPDEDESEGITMGGM